MFSWQWILVQWIGYTWLFSGCEYQQIFPVQFCPPPFILVHFPPHTRMLCLLRSNSKTKSQSASNKPQLGQTGYISSLWNLVFFAGVVQLECRTQNMDQINRGNSFSQFLFSSKIKRQKDAISPQRSLLYACAGLSRDTFEREENNGFESCAKFHIRLWNRLILLQTISIIRKCYPSLFAHFHDALLHIILICPRLWFKKTHLGIRWIDWGKLHNNIFTFFVCIRPFLVLSEYRVGLFKLIINSIKVEIQSVHRVICNHHMLDKKMQG